MLNYWDHIGLCFGHIKAMFWLLLQYLCFYMTEMAQNLAKKKYSCPVKLFGPYWCHVWAISGPCLGHIRAMFWLFLQQLCFQMPKLLKYSLKIQTCQLEECSFMLTYQDHIWAMFGTYQDHGLSISTIYLLLDAKKLKFSLKGYVWTISVPFFGYFYKIVPSRCLKLLKYH